MKKYINSILLKKKVQNWIKSEKSNQTADEGFWTYGKIVIGVIALGIIVGVITIGFTEIGDWFLDAVRGDATTPNGWGNTGGTGN